MRTFGWLLSLALVSSAQRSAATSPASHQLQSWLAAYDGADWDGYLAFVKKSFVTEPEPMLRNPAFRDMTGGFDLAKIEAETPVQVTAIVRERNSDQRARMVMEVEAAEPHHIVKLHPQPIPPAHLPEQELLARTREYAQERVSHDQFSGVVLIAKNGQPLVEHAYGFADRERHLPNTLQTRFGTASLGKMFTAVATLQLVEAGKLKLDDPIGKYLIDYPNRELASKVTISELLSHTGGTGDIFGPEFEQHRRELRTHEDYIRLFGSRSVLFAPGSRWEYSNYGFVLLGAVIDQVSGQNYYDYLRDHIFLPAGMISTGSAQEGEPVPRRSVEYTKQGGSTWHHSMNSGPRATAAGGATTTVRDLLRFANALQNHKLLDTHGMELLTTGHVAMPRGGQYAYGFQDLILNGVRCFGHDGGGPGVSGDLRICPVTGYVVAVLANMDPPAAQRISNFVVNQLPEPHVARQ